jgi:hypothetical protein
MHELTLFPSCGCVLAVVAPTFAAVERTQDDEALFHRLCAWDDASFLLGAATTEGSDEVQREDGLFDGHAYSVITCLNDVAGTDVDLIKMRNPHGSGELTTGIWGDHGAGWELYPQIKDAIQPVVADDGVFWVSRQEFFHFFPVIFLCACDMKEFARAASR